MYNNLMEIWFDNYLLFPYAFLDYLAKEQWHSFLNTAIYFILKEDKKRIVSCSYQNDGLTITYKNLKTNCLYDIKGIHFFDCCIPYEGITIDISAGSYLEIGINKLGFEFLKKYDPISFSKYDGCSAAKIPLFEIIMASEEGTNISKDYSLQYIGQSTKIQDRLSRHEKIQKIMRDIEIMDANSELVVLLYHPMSKFCQGFDLPSYQTTFLTGNSEWQRWSSLASKIGDKELLDSTEAMLIQCFNPPYNDNFKNTLPRNTQKTFSILESCGISQLHIGLDLQLSGNITMNISTNSVSTNKCKKILLSCSLDSLSQNKNGSINVDEVDDWLFNLLG